MKRRTAWVYRIFDRNSGRLLYVGRTVTPAGRMALHCSGGARNQTRKHEQEGAFPRAVREGRTRPEDWRVVWSAYSNDKDADEVESEAIWYENPIYNVRGVRSAGQYLLDLAA